MKGFCFKILECIASCENEKRIPLCHITEKAEMDIWFLLCTYSSHSTTKYFTHVMFSWDVVVRNI